MSPRCDRSIQYEAAGVIARYINTENIFDNGFLFLYCLLENKEYKENF